VEFCCCKICRFCVQEGYRERKMSDDETMEFAVLCRMLDAVARSKAAIKRKHLHTFLEYVYSSRHYFGAMRLILPQLDKERANYGLKEAVLAKLLAEALGLSKDAEDAKKLQNWRKGGQRAGSNAGNFILLPLRYDFIVVVLCVMCLLLCCN